MASTKKQTKRIRNLLELLGFKQGRNTKHMELWECNDRENCTVGISLDLVIGRDKGGRALKKFKSGFKQALQKCDPPFDRSKILVELSKINFIAQVSDDPNNEPPAGKTIDELIDWCFEEED